MKGWLPRMVVGALQFELLFYDARSLKDKRRVIQSLKDRLHRDLLVSVAEIGAHDSLARAVMAIACVAPDGRRAGEVLDHVSDRLRAVTDAELGQVRRELYHEDLLAEKVIDAQDLAAEMLASAEETDE